MASRRRKFDAAPMPLSSMIDVVFLLLIYFIVTQKEIVADTFLKTDLPNYNTAKSSPNLFSIDVAVVHPEDPELDFQTYLVNGRRWRFADLQQQLIRTGEQDPDLTVLITCDPNAEHRKLVQLLDACHQANLTKLNLVSNDGIPFQPQR